MRANETLRDLGALAVELMSTVRCLAEKNEVRVADQRVVVSRSAFITPLSSSSVVIFLPFWQLQEARAVRDLHRITRAKKEGLMTNVRDIMTSDPVCVRPEDSIQKAALLMKSQHVGPVPVVDHQQRLVGIVTDRDLAIKVIAEGRDSRRTKVADVMSRDPYTSGPNDDVEQVIRTMEEHQVRRIPIVDEECCLIGIVSQADVATRMNEPAKVAEAVEEISRPSDRESC